MTPGAGGGPEVRVGPAGWSYEDWRGIVYPEPRPRGFDELAYLARFFGAIEINSTFYRPPTARTAESWARRVADRPGFLFTVKLWNRFSHEPGSPPSEPEIRAAQEGVRPLVEAGKVGAWLLQLPWSVRDASEARDRIRRAAEAFRGTAPVVLEPRHVSWGRPEALEFLAKEGLGFCNIDQPAGPDSLTGTEHVLSRVGYVRLHGRNREAWFRRDAGRDERYNYLYSGDELRAWVEKVQRMGKRAGRIFVIANNHFQGKAVANALELQFELTGEAPGAPGTLAQRYSGVAEGSRPAAVGIPHLTERRRPGGDQGGAC